MLRAVETHWFWLVLVPKLTFYWSVEDFSLFQQLHATRCPVFMEILNDIMPDWSTTPSGGMPFSHICGDRTTSSVYHMWRTLNHKPAMIVPNEKYIISFWLRDGTLIHDHFHPFLPPFSTMLIHHIPPPFSSISSTFFIHFFHHFLVHFFHFFQHVTAWFSPSRKDWCHPYPSPGPRSQRRVAALRFGQGITSD